MHCFGDLSVLRLSGCVFLEQSMRSKLGERARLSGLPSVMCSQDLRPSTAEFPRSEVTKHIHTPGNPLFCPIRRRSTLPMACISSPTLLLPPFSVDQEWHYTGKVKMIFNLNLLDPSTLS